MRAGELRYRVEFQARTVTTDEATNENVVSFPSSLRRFVGIKQLSGDERIAAAQNRAVTVCKFVGHASDWKAAKEFDRIVYDGRAYDIKRIDKWDAIGGVIITAEAGLNAG